MAYVSMGIGEALVRRRPRVLGDVVSDLLNAGSNVLNDVGNTAKNDTQNAAGDEISKLLKGSQLKPLLDAVEGKAHDGAIQAAKENAPWLIGLTIAGGLLGGVVGGLVGKAPASVLGVAGGGFCAYMMAKGSSSAGK